MCDCYWTYCKECKEVLPVHIGDFCMPREDIEVYCANHLPEKDVVVYELIEDAYYREEEFEILEGHIPGWKMGVRYLKEPPQKYGLSATEPNIGAEHIAEVRFDNGKRKYFPQSMSEKLFSTKLQAIRFIIKDLIQREKRLKKETQYKEFITWVKKDKELWKQALNYEKKKLLAKRCFRNLGTIKEVKDKLIGVMLIGSLATREYIEGISDIDLYVIAEDVKPGLKIEYIHNEDESIEINLVMRTPQAAEERLNKGMPVDILALKYGEIIYDKKRFLKKLIKKELVLTDESAKIWLNTATRNLWLAFHEYFSPSCYCCFFKGIFHSMRDFARLILIKKGIKKPIEGWELIKVLEEKEKRLFKSYCKLRKARINWRDYKFNLLAERKSLDTKLGNLLKLSISTARRAYKYFGLTLPNIENILRQLNKEEKIDHISSIDICAESKKLIVFYKTLNEDELKRKEYLL